MRILNPVFPRHPLGLWPHLGVGSRRGAEASMQIPHRPQTSQNLQNPLNSLLHIWNKLQIRNPNLIRRRNLRRILTHKYLQKNGHPPQHRHARERPSPMSHTTHKHILGTPTQLSNLAPCLILPRYIKHALEILP